MKRKSDSETFKNPSQSLYKDLLEVLWSKTIDQTICWSLDDSTKNLCPYYKTTLFHGEDYLTIHVSQVLVRLLFYKNDKNVLCLSGVEERSYIQRIIDYIEEERNIVRKEFVKEVTSLLNSL